MKELLSLVVEKLKEAVKHEQVEQIQALTNLLALLNADGILDR